MTGAGRTHYSVDGKPVSREEFDRVQVRAAREFPPHTKSTVPCRIDYAGAAPLGVDGILVSAGSHITFPPGTKLGPVLAPLPETFTVTAAELDRIEELTKHSTRAGANGARVLAIIDRIRGRGRA